MSISTLRSLTPWTDVVLGAAMLGSVAIALTASSWPVLPAVGGVLWFIALAALLNVIRARWRAAALTRDLPFEMVGYLEALHHPAHVLQNPMDTPGIQRVEVRLDFAGPVAPKRVLERLVQTVALPKGARIELLDVSANGRALLMLSGGTHVDGHRRWSVRLMKRLAAEFVALDREFGLRRVELAGD